MFKNIIVPTDFSPTADKALALAVGLARKQNGTVTLLHTYHLAYNDASQWSAATDLELLRIAEQSTKEQLDKQAAKYSDAGVEIVKDARYGLLADELKHTEGDLVVMGTTGANTFIRKLLGSNAVSVLNTIKKPLLLVPSDATLAENIQKISFGTQLEYNDLDAIGRVKDLTKQLGASLYLVKVTAENQLDIVDDNSWKQKIMETHGGDIQQFDVMRAPSVSAGLQAYAKDQNIDLIVMAKRGLSRIDRFFEPSQTEKMAARTHIPLLVISI